MHLLAIAGRVGVELTLETSTGSAATCHCLVDLMPSGRFLMEDFYYAGGLPVVLRALGERGLLHKDALTVNGRTLWENVADGARAGTARSSRPSRRRSSRRPALPILRGNLAPNGAVIKPVRRLAAS